jgi:hypothetical protein
MQTFQSILLAFGLITAAQAWGSDWNNTYVTTTITTDIYTSKSRIIASLRPGTDFLEPSVPMPPPSNTVPTHTLLQRASTSQSLSTSSPLSLQLGQSLLTSLLVALAPMFQATQASQPQPGSTLTHTSIQPALLPGALRFMSPRSRPSIPTLHTALSQPPLFKARRHIRSLRQLH